MAGRVGNVLVVATRRGRIGPDDWPVVRTSLEALPIEIDPVSNSRVWGPALELANAYGISAHDAYDLAIDTIETAAAMFAEAGRPFPPPAVARDDFSGRVTLRLPKSLHWALARAAGDEGISLNKHLVTVLASHAGALTAGNAGS